MNESGDITQILTAAREGERGALDEVFSRVYSEIRRIAHNQIQGAGPNRTLNTTAIVHEAYIKLVRSPSIPWEDRAHFMAVAATVMRQIVLNYARSHRAQKRGGGVRPFVLDEIEAPVESRAAELVELGEALRRLSALDGRLAKVVDLRFFAGLSVEETAEILGVTDRTVKRDWRMARAFLYRELHGEATE